MPVVCLVAQDFGITGKESPDEIEQNISLLAAIEDIRLKAGVLMGLGDVRERTVPKMSLISPGEGEIDVSTRTLIPHKVHESIGVLGAVSVATAALVQNTVANRLRAEKSSPSKEIKVGHPSGFFGLQMDIEDDGKVVDIKKSILVRTARLLMRGEVYF